MVSESYNDRQINFFSADRKFSGKKVEMFDLLP